MKFPRYERYKPSSLEWMQDVPDHWEVNKISYGFRKIGSGTTPKSDSSEYYDGDVPWVTTSELRETVITDTRQKVTNEALKDYPTLRLYPVGTILFAMYGATIGRLGILGIPATVNQACCAMAWPTRFDAMFIYYWLWMRRPILVSLSSGGGQPNLSQDDLREIRIPTPPIAEQRSIAAFLDRETGRIDRLVAKKRELIERLKEKRTALISRTVTRGVPPTAARAAGLPANPPLKPSGIDWLGEIPEHWEVKKLSWLFRYAKGPNAATLTKEYVADNGGDYPVFSGQTENNGLMGMIDWYEFDCTSPVIFVTTVGARAMTTRLVSGRFSLSQNCALIIPRCGNANPYFFEPVLRCLFDYERRSISLIMQPSLRFDDLDKFRVPLPPPKEQTAIASYLNAETARMDALLAKVEEAIERLQEFRTALITAAVTGKIDVREELAS
jgi:restriction endonuclease S subunit